MYKCKDKEEQELKDFCDIYVRRHAKRHGPTTIFNALLRHNVGSMKDLAELISKHKIERIRHLGPTYAEQIFAAFCEWEHDNMA